MCSDKSLFSEDSDDEEFTLDSSVANFNGLEDQYDTFGLKKAVTENGYDYTNLFSELRKRKKKSGKLVKYKPPLIKSQFYHVPPTINFAAKGEKSNLTRYFSVAFIN